MIRVLFICHGNICRSTMAQFVFQDMINRQNLADKFLVDSIATSTEEIGIGPHYGTVQKLREVGVPVLAHRASQLRRSDYEEFDYLIGMDSMNIRNIMRIIGKDTQKKVYRLLDFSDSPRDIADPWYTGNFESTYRDVLEGCEGFLAYLEKNERL